MNIGGEFGTEPFLALEPKAVPALNVALGEKKLARFPETDWPL